MASIRWSAVLFGLGAGVLVLALASLVLWLVLSAFGVEGAVGAATTFGTLAGFAAAGWVAGRRAGSSPAFNGAVAAMGIALAVVVTSIFGGSPAPILQVVLLAVFAMLVGSAAAIMAVR